MEGGDPRELRKEALAAMNGGDQDKALQLAEQAVKMDPDTAASHTVRAAILSRIGRGDEALAGFRRAASLEPSNARHHFNIASQLDSMGRPEEALREAEEAHTLDPSLQNLAPLLQKLKVAVAAAPQRWDILQTPMQQPEAAVAPAALRQSAYSGWVQSESNESGSGVNSYVPAEVRKWNWGAFLPTGPLWALSMKITVPAVIWLVVDGLYWVLSLMSIPVMQRAMTEAAKAGGKLDPAAMQGNSYAALSNLLWLVAVIMHVYFGISGNTMAWKARRFESIDQFFQVQKSWMLAGFGSLLLACLGMCLLFGTLIMALVNAAPPGK